MSNMVTRCPQCQTSFKVTEEHLKIANGAVRCGSCLLVFQARQHWVNPDNVSAAPSPQSTAPASKFQFDQSVIDSAAATSAPTKPVASGNVAPAHKVETDTSAHHKKLEEIGD